MSGSSSLSLLVTSFGADFNRHKCSEMLWRFLVQFGRGDTPCVWTIYWTEVLELVRLGGIGGRQVTVNGTRRLVSAWLAQWAPMMPSNNPMPLQWSRLGSILWWEHIPRPLCSSFWFSNTANSAELLSFGRPTGVAPMGCACSKASQASQPGQDAKELCEVRRV